jgi:hypothetical protein
MYNSENKITSTPTLKYTHCYCSHHTLKWLFNYEWEEIHILLAIGLENMTKFSSIYANNVLYMANCLLTLPFTCMPSLTVALFQAYNRNAQ